MNAGRVGDAGVPNSDVFYSGADTQPAPWSLDYYRNKAREFQDTLNALDQAQGAVIVALQLGVDDSTEGELLAALDEFEGKKTVLRATAEAINAGASFVNSVGGRMPEVSIPTGLGAFPLLPVAAIAAVATAATLIVWGRAWIAGVNDRLATAQLLDASDPAKRDQLVQQIATVQAAQKVADSTGFAALAPVVKWGAILLLGFMAYKVAGPLLLGGKGHGSDD